MAGVGHPPGLENDPSLSLRRPRGVRKTSIRPVNRDSQRLLA